MLHNRWSIFTLLILVRSVMGFRFQGVASITPFLVALVAWAMPLADFPFVLSALTGLFAAALAEIIMGMIVQSVLPLNRIQGNTILYTYFFQCLRSYSRRSGLDRDVTNTVVAPVFLSATILALTAPLFLG